MIPQNGHQLSPVNQARCELTRLAHLLADAGVLPEVILDDAREGIEAAIRRHARSGR